MIDRGMARVGRGGLPSVIALAACLLAGAAAPMVPADPPPRGFDLQARLEDLDPARPIEYLELAEEIAEGLATGESADRVLARRLYGLAGRLDPDRLAASAALGLASLATDARTKERYRAAASLLDPESVRSVTADRPEVDAETALEIGEAFGDFRSGRTIGLRRALQDPARERLIQGWDHALPGGIEWLRRQTEAGGRQRPVVDRTDALAMIRVELALLDRGRPQWSTLLALEGDPPIVDLRVDRVPSLLLDDAAASRPRHRGGAWVEEAAGPTGGGVQASGS